MEQVQVQVIGAQPAQAVLQTAAQLSPAGMEGIHFGDEKQLFPVQPVDSLSHQLFRPALPIHLGRINQGHAELDAPPERIHFLSPGAEPLAQVPGALAQSGHLSAVLQAQHRRQSVCFHCNHSCHCFCGRETAFRGLRNAVAVGVM